MQHSKGNQNERTDRLKPIFEFEIPGKPCGKGRPRFTRNGHTFTPEQTVNYENLVKLTFRGAYPEAEPIAANTPIRAELRLYFPIPQSISKKKREFMSKRQAWYTKKCDIDNATKIIFDALNLLAYRDDAQICELYAVKLYSDTPRVEVKFWEAKVE